MTVGFGHSVIICLFLFFLLEIVLRFCRLKSTPLSYRLAYAFFLLPQKCFNEIYAINQRVERGGFKDFNGLFEHYAKVSGKSFEDIVQIHLPEKFWPYLIRGQYESGGHCIFKTVQKMHAGVRPAPNQQLKAISIDDKGFRRTGYEGSRLSGVTKEKTVVFLGGSVLFGLGATSDKNSIAGRVGYYLNEKFKNDAVSFRVINAGMLGYNSYQELLSLMELDIQPDYVVSLGGWNEVDQALAVGEAGKNLLAALSDRNANRPVVKSLILSCLSYFVVFHVLRRFIEAYRAYGAGQDFKMDHFQGQEDRDCIYTMY